MCKTYRGLFFKFITLLFERIFELLNYILLYYKEKKRKMKKQKFILKLDEYFNF